MRQPDPAFDFLVIGIDRNEVELRESVRAGDALRMLIATPETARAYQERVEIAFRGS